MHDVGAFTLCLHVDDSRDAHERHIIQLLSTLIMMSIRVHHLL